MPFIWIIYIATAIVSIAIALLLFNLTKLSGQAITRLKGKGKQEEELTLDAISYGSLRQIIFEEVNELVDSIQQSQEISRKLSSALSKELENRINIGNQKLRKKYESIIEEKVKNEEIAWDKYKKVLNDKKNTETIIRSIAEGLMVLDEQGKVIMMNPAAENLLGVSKKDMVGKSILDNLKEEGLISLVKDSEKKEGIEIELISPHDETKKIIRASSAVIENENGQTIGMVSVLSDITKQKELDRLKSEFVANVSHELRTPLVAIDESLSLILNKEAGVITETQERFLSIAERNLKRLTRLINDLLDLSKIEAGKMELKKQYILIDKSINEAIDNFNTWAQTKSIKIEKKIQEGLPKVNIDPDRIIQVLNNLIGNAIKFTSNNGNITIEAGLENQSREIKISVTDTGIGIDKEDLPKVFDKFYQAGERIAADINGTGIGLSIAKEIVVELHGGRIWAESQKGFGTKFIFTLPLKDNQ